MLLLEREKSKSLIVADALLRRLETSDDDYPYFYEVSKRLHAGFEGEKMVDRHWFEMTNLEKHSLFFNYELMNEFGFPHQIDTLLLTPKFLFILDIKHMSGRVDYEEEKNQFIRTRQDGVIESFSDPVAQVLRHGQYFERLFTNLQITLPIEYAIVFSNPSTIIGQVPKSVPFFHTSGLRFHVSKLLSKHSPVLTEKSLNKLSKLLLSSLKRKDTKPAISIDRIKKGVLCESCNYQVQMIYRNRTWYCPKCSVQNKIAFYQALDDYRILINDRITNREFRDFFGIDSMQIASKILSRLGLVAVGDKKGRYYIIPENIASRI